MKKMNPQVTKAIQNQTARRAIRFLISGGSAAAIEYGSYLIMRQFGIRLLIANTISFILGLFVSFLLNRKWVFNSIGKQSRQFISYLALALVNLILSNLLLGFAVLHLHWSGVITKLGLMCLIASWNYVVFSKLIFKTAQQDATASSTE